MRRATVSYNVASGNGGGFYLDACSLEAYGTQPDADGNHLDYNEAHAGGAIFANHASGIRLGSNIGSGRTDFLGNYAATTGGAFHLIGEDTVAVMTASRFESNAAGQRGGSLYVADQALFRMERGHTEPLLCPEFPCSALISSRAGIEGSVAIARANARIEIHESVIADDGTGPAVPAIVAVGSDTLLLANNILMHGMSGEGIVLERRRTGPRAVRDIYGQRVQQRPSHGRRYDHPVRAIQHLLGRARSGAGRRRERCERE